MRPLLLVVLIGCTPAPPAPALTSASAPSTAAAPSAPPAAWSARPAASSARPVTTRPRGGCTDVAGDIAKRAPDAKPSSVKLDLDGDGVRDPVFTGFCSMMGGNCQTHLYASNDGCPRYVGEVQVTVVSSGPKCADPPQGRVPCRLSAPRMMIHGEVYEYFYVWAADGYKEAGVGHRGKRPPH